MENGSVDVLSSLYLFSKENIVYVITLFVCQSQTNMFWDIACFNQIWQTRNVSKIMMFLTGDCSVC